MSTHLIPVLASGHATFGLHLRPWFLVVFLISAAIFLSSGVHFLIFRLIRRKEAQSTIRPGAPSHSTLGWGLQTYLGRPSRAIFLLTCLLAILPAIESAVDDVPGWAFADLRQGLILALVASLGWFVIGLVYVFQAATLKRYDINAENNIQARRVHTQFQIIRRLIIGFIVILTAGAMLWSFDDPRIWHYGSGLLASAGVASLILATAAKSTVANVLAGIQIAFTEPMRMDDVVVVQGEWGRVEEITSAYVVIKIWDLRRLIVPLSYFIENSFQNWSRDSTDLMGTSFLYVDYSIPVAELRAQLEAIVHPHPNWDGKVCGLQVTNLTEHTMELRCLMSSKDSSLNFDLRCDVREQMTAWIQQRYPDAFPRTRFEALADGKQKLPQTTGANPT